MTKFQCFESLIIDAHVVRLKCNCKDDGVVLWLPVWYVISWAGEVRDEQYSKTKQTNKQNK